ncbi:MAG: nucleotidyl transferase AbiEii/AbiGii toxin family protein [Bacteroidales bacterium]|nr:nucleotidyl transferase AbiEii/AbiGii toxin family protein [Bacteroidales bacterium]
MTDINRHRFLLVQILKDIYSDLVLANCLAFKGGTALMFFYDLPRFSVDLDFNLTARENEEEVYQKVRTIILKYGEIFDEAMKFYGPVIVLNYGKGERKLKVEISNRDFNDRYEIKNFLGINIRVMVAADMFAHKLCSLLDRPSLAGRDVFDIWFFLKNNFPVNQEIVRKRMNKSLPGYLRDCIIRLETADDRIILHGTGTLTDQELTRFARKGMRSETIDLLKFYEKYPIIDESAR